MGLLNKLFKKIVAHFRNPKIIDDTTIKQESLNSSLQNAKELKTDLVEAEYFRGCCGECAKYRGRWFSISGKDNRFPKMPTDYNCSCEGILFMPVIYGVSEPEHCPKSKNIIEYSNRPFIDDRTKKEKEIHQHTLDTVIYDEIKEQDKKDYDELLKALPSNTPKTFSAYRRMKFSETANFIKLAEKASNIGIDIRLSQDKKAIIERYNKYEKANK